MLHNQHKLSLPCSLYSWTTLIPETLQSSMSNSIMVVIHIKEDNTHKTPCSQHSCQQSVLMKSDRYLNLHIVSSHLRYNQFMHSTIFITHSHVDWYKQNICDVIFLCSTHPLLCCFVNIKHISIFVYLFILIKGVCVKACFTPFCLSKEMHNLENIFFCQYRFNL